MAATREDVIEYLKGMTLLEASQLVKELEETFGVSAAAAAVAAAPAAGRAQVTRTAQTSNTTALLIAVSAVNDRIVWASGAICQIVLFGSDAFRAWMQQAKEVSRGFFGLRTTNHTSNKRTLLRRMEKLSWQLHVKM